MGTLRASVIQACAIAFGLAADCALVRGQTPDYFPLQVGNSWVYRLSGEQMAQPDVKTITVDATETIGEREYFRVNFFGQTVYLRRNSDGAIYSVDRETATERLWLPLNAPVGTNFETSIANCTGTGSIVSRNEKVPVPAANVTDAVQIRFQTTCADAGFSEQFYGPWNGLVRHVETSIAGPRRYDLVYSRTGPLNLTGPEVAFTIALDAPRYKPGAPIAVRLALRSTQPEPIALYFPSGQSFDLQIFNDKGETVYTWSADKLFAAIVRDERFGPGEKTYGFTAAVQSLPAGRYKARAFLTTAPLLYAGETSFQIIP